jgi:hypothetical protein
VSAPRNIVSLQAARVQQPVGEDVAALGIGASWISSTARNATGRGPLRHRLDRADEIARALGGTIFSSPVISATWRFALQGRATMRS